MRQTIVPPYLLLRLAHLEDPAMEHVRRAARRALAVDPPFREVRNEDHPDRTDFDQPVSVHSGDAGRTIFDAHNTESLPGAAVRREGDAATSDTTVNEAYDGLGNTYALLRDVYDRDSIDGEGLNLHGTVHFGVDYDNAFWDGERMVFGDGDGMVFRRFTASLSVIGHELAHGLTQSTANLTYSGQSGALNESVSDVFGALVEQYTAGHAAGEASWLIGAGLFTERVEGVALRSMRAPGTAYDDAVLGKDPQPDTMSGYVTTREDNGGVHVNSGIPNRAFFLTADAIGGNAWEGAGRIWYDTLVSGAIRADAGFAQFARATVDAAAARFGPDSREHSAVGDAWTTVGVEAQT